MQDMQILDKSTWPTNTSNDDININHRKQEITRLANKFHINQERCVWVMHAFCDGESNPDGLQAAINTTPCSTAECELDFSLMNIIATDLRSSLTVANIANLPFVNINGPPLLMWIPKDYVQSWLLKDCAATDTRSRVQQQSSIDTSRKAMCDLL